MEAWFKLHRGIFREGLLDDDDALRVYLCVSSRAAIRDQRSRIGNKFIHLKCGEAIYSIKSIADECLMSTHRARGAIGRLTAMKLISVDAQRRRGSRARIVIPNPAFDEQGFVQFPRAIYDDKKWRKFDSKLKCFVYLAIHAEHTDRLIDGRVARKAGEVVVNHESLQVACNLTSSQVSAAIKALHASFYLISEHDPNKSTALISLASNTVRTIQQAEIKKTNQAVVSGGGLAVEPQIQRKITANSTQNNRKITAFNKNCRIKNYNLTVNQPVGSDVEDIVIKRVDNKKQLISVRSDNPDSTIPFDLSAWPSEPDYDLFCEFVSMFIDKTGNPAINQKYLQNLGSPLHSMKLNRGWDVNACLRKMIIERWISIDPKYRALGGAGEEYAGGFIEKHSDRSWADGL